MNIRTFLAFVSSCAVELLYQTALIATRLPGMSGGTLSRQIRGRSNGPDSARSILTSEKTAGDILFFCSSAGEFEQARPVMDLVTSRLGLDPMVLFLSRSGLDYIRARGEKVRAALAPPDAIWRWRRFDARHRIRGAVVIRHEWWPAFLNVFSGRVPVLLIDAVIPAGSPESTARNVGRGYLARNFSKVCTVDSATSEFFTTRFGVDPTLIRATGDTKYDRVADRAARTRISDELRAEVTGFAAGRNILVCGSIYDADLGLITTAWRKDPRLNETWAVIAAPHHVDQETTNSLRQQIQRAGCDFLLVPRMGALAELYSLADAAWIGGACHNKVHNVLEPASHGVKLACGMKFKNSAEAVEMHRTGLLRAVEDPDDLIGWLRASVGADSPEPGHASPADFVRSRTGAAQEICAVIAQSLRETESRDA